jgi:DNA (cytosine-5)-methyltransferase 1
MSTRMNARPKVISVFSGIGGLDLGLEAAGFQHIGLIESSPLCRETLKANRPRWRHLPWNDVHEAAEGCTPSFFGLEMCELDLLAGAPPCQPFSTAAQWSSSARRGLADARANTLSAFFRLARTFLPKTILLENVPSLWSSEFGVNSLIDTFFKNLEKDTGTQYTLYRSVLNAADFGVPQVRRRAILVARRDADRFDWPPRKYAKRPMTAWDALHTVAPASKPECRGKWAGLLPSIPEGWNYLWHTDGGEGLNLFGYRTKFWSFLLKLARDKPSWTIAAQPGPSTGPFHWENRPLAAEELLALQTFPKRWALAGTYRDHVRLIGNATPPLLAELLGKAIRPIDVHQKRCTYLPIRARARPISAPPASVPKRYRHLIDNHAPHPGAGKGPQPRVASNES